MSNTLIIDSLNTLFSMSNTAVIGAQEQFVAFMNPAAQELFRGNRTNHKLTELLPAHITEATATEFVTSATIEKRHVIISVTSFGAFRLFSFVPQDENALRAGAQFAPFLASLNAFRTLTTYFSDYAMQLSDVRFRRNAAELTQFYYRLLRFTLNASTASGLYDGTLAFMPQLCDLGKECRTLLDNIQPITDANGIVLEVSIPDEPINCALDTALIQRMLLNIIANCTERCKHGDRIRFTVTQEGDHADIVPRRAQHGAAGNESLPCAEGAVWSRTGRSHPDLPVRSNAETGAVSKHTASQRRAAQMGSTPSFYSAVR